VTTWAAGAYPRMAERLRPVAAVAVAQAAVATSDRVVDVATGTGNAALLAAGRGAAATGVDAEPALRAVAKGRAREEALPVSWVQADMAAMPVPDEYADMVPSVFGVRYARTTPGLRRNWPGSPHPARVSYWRAGSPEACCPGWAQS